MSTTEDHVRAYVAVLADEASHGDASHVFPSRATARPRSRWVSIAAPSAAAACAVFVVAFAANSLGSGQGAPAANDSSGSSSVAPSANSDADRAVEGLVQSLRDKGIKFSPAANWDVGTLLLAAANPSDAALDGLDGQVVGGLRIIVVKAGVTERDGDRAIVAIGASDYGARIDSFGYTDDRSALIARVKGYESLTGEERSTLVAELERVGGVRVELANPIPVFNW